MRFVADIMVLLGAVLLTFGTDLLIISHGDPVGAPLGVIASVLGAMLLTAGLLNHHRLSLRTKSEASEGSGDAGVRLRGKSGDRHS